MTTSSSNRFTAAISTWLLVEGIWGMFSPVVFGLFSTNRLHATIHVVLGVTGLLLALRDRVRPFLWFLGLLLLAVGGLYFSPRGRGLTDYLAVNQAVAVLNLAVGVVSLIFATKSANRTTNR